MLTDTCCARLLFTENKATTTMSRDESSVDDFQVKEFVTELEEMLIDLENIEQLEFEFNVSEKSDASSESSVERQQIGQINRNRLRQFYGNRKDVLLHFDDDKIRKTFRFDRASINFICGNKIFRILPISYQPLCVGFRLGRALFTEEENNGKTQTITT